MKKNNLFLILIFALALFLRFYQLGFNPPSLTWDEAAWGYNAYSLGLTGRDEFGRWLPLNYLESFGDFKPPLYAFLTVLPVKVFGLNEFATRFASAFFGSLTVLMTYFLMKEIFGCTRRPTIRGGYSPTPEERLSLVACHVSHFASFFLAISPWHIMLSRAAFEANVASFFLISGVAFFLIGIRKKGWWLSLSAVSFALSLHTFNTARVVVPLLVLILVIGFREKLWQKKKWALVAFLSGLIVVLPAISFFLAPQARLRFKEVNIFSDSSVVVTANQEMANDRVWLATLSAKGGFTWWSRILHNRRWGYFQQFLHHYFDHFRPDFLFFKGDGNPKFSTQDVGELYLWELPFLIAGLLFLFKKKPGFWWLIPAWLLVGIIPAATARETPHALRIETTLPTWQILTAFGVVEFWRWTNKQKALIRNILRVTCGVLLVTNLIYFQHGYWRHYPAEFSGEWQYGYKPAIEFIKSVEADYDEVWLTNKLGRPYIYLLFYLQKDPREFWSEAGVERDTYGFVKVRNFDQYHFYSTNDTPWKKGVLFVDTADSVPEKAKVLKTFYLLNGNEVLKAFEV